MQILFNANPGDQVGSLFLVSLSAVIPAFTFSIQQLPLIVPNYASFDFGWVDTNVDSHHSVK